MGCVFCHHKFIRGSEDDVKPATGFGQDDFITVPKLVVDYNSKMGELTIWTSSGAAMI